MKKVLFASLLAVAGAASMTTSTFAQQAVSLGQNANGQVQMSAEEYKAYNDASTATTPAAKATGFEAYLKAYPNSAVKADVLQDLLFAYVQSNDSTSALGAADRLLVADPNNLRAYVYEVQLRRDAADKLTDPAAKQAAYDQAAGYAQKGLLVTKPKDMGAADFATLKGVGFPIFYSAIGTDALNKKDTATAISAFTSELKSVPVAQTTAPGLQLQDTYYLSQAYYTSSPQDFLNCAYYSARAASYAPEPYKSQFSKLATYCYTKYHGKAEGYDAMVAIAAANLTPPATFAVSPAPKPADIVSNLIATTPDLATLALSDKEYVWQNGKQADADKVFDTVKGKSVEVPDCIVISATADQLLVAVSDDAKQAQPKPTADFAFNFTTPLKVIPAVGATVTLTGTYASYTQSPLLITMSDATVVEKKKKPAAPGHHPVHH